MPNLAMLTARSAKVFRDRGVERGTRTGSRQAMGWRRKVVGPVSGSTGARVWPVEQANPFHTRVRPDA